MKSGIDRYESEIIDKLWLLEKEGKGKVQELATFKVGGQHLPFVAFITGSDIVVTARHHINEFWGTTEAIMKLAESGQKGFTLIPVVDVENYTSSEEKKDKLTNAEPEWASALTHDMYFGYKDGPVTYAKNQWQDYRYGNSDSPEHISGIKKLIDSCTLYIDIHNSAVQEFFFLSVLPDISNVPDLFKDLGTQVEAKGQSLGCLSGRSYRKTIYPGIYHFFSQSGNTAINYAASKGKLNLGYEVPVFKQKQYLLREWPVLNSVDEMASITSETILGLRGKLTI